MNKNSILALLLGLGIIIFPEVALAHIKWFVAFDISDPPKSLIYWISNTYIIGLFILSVWGVSIASLVDSYWCRKFGKFTYISDFFSSYEDVSLNIARIGTGVFFVGIWLVGGVILTPELLTDNEYIPFIQLLIAISVLFKKTLVISGMGILVLYGIALYEYGLFHLLDYLTLVGLATYLILSSIKYNRFTYYRFPILYGTLIFAFLWSAIEKLAFPQWFYPFLEKNPVITMGFDNDFFLASAAFIEFTLFFLLLMGKNSVIIFALLANIVIISGNIYFGKMDAIGHFPVNFILLIMMIKGSLPVKIWCFDHSCKHYLSTPLVALSYILTLIIILSLYYGIHWLLY